jgi:hypothetical protein
MASARQSYTLTGRLMLSKTRSRRNNIASHMFCFRFEEVLCIAK